MSRPRSKSRAPDADASSRHLTDDPSTPERRRHDPTYKGFFGHSVTAFDLVRDGLAPKWHEVLDLDEIVYTFTETIAPGPRGRLCDASFWVPFKDGSRSAVFVVDFKSSPHPEAAAIMCDYHLGMFTALRTKPNQMDPGGVMPVIVPCVVYTGPEPWNAKRSLADLGGTPEPPPEAARALAGVGTAHSYQLLDLQRASAQDFFPKDSVLAWLGALEREPWKNFPRVHAAMAKKWGGPGHRAVRESFAAWVEERLRKADVPKDVRENIAEQVIQPTETAEMGMTYTEWADGHRAAQGRLMVLRLASRKFGTETAERLERLVGAMGPEQLVQVFDTALDCETGDDLLTEAANGITVAS